MTASEYLVFERSSEEKHEYYRGEIFAMGGASRAHNTISLNIGSEFRQLFRDRDCVAFVADMRVKVSTTGKYAYPDVVVTCEEARFEDEYLDTLVNPQVIVEVLSKSTESYDRGRKFEFYRRIESLSDYVLVSQDRIAAEHFWRHEDGTWQMRGLQALDERLELSTADCGLALKDIYHKVDLDASQAADESTRR